MSTPSYGANTWLGIGEESTWGTSVARTKFFEFVNEGLQIDKQIAFSRVARGLDPVRSFVQFEIGRGEVGMEMMYAGYLKWLKHLLGTATDTTLTATKSYRHEFVRAAVLPEGLTVEVNLDQQNLLFVGMRVAQAVLRCTPDVYPEILLSLSGKTGTINGSPSTPTFATDRPISPSTAVLTIGGVDYSGECSSVEFTIGNALDTERRQIGATTPKPAVRGKSRPEVEIKMQFEHSSLTKDLMADFKNGTERAVKLKYTGGVIGTSTDPYIYMIECPACDITAASPGVNDPGIPDMPLSLTAKSAVAGAFENVSANAGAIKVTIQNEEATT